MLIVDLLHKFDLEVELLKVEIKGNQVHAKPPFLNLEKRGRSGDWNQNHINDETYMK